MMARRSLIAALAAVTLALPGSALAQSPDAGTGNPDLNLPATPAPTPPVAPTEGTGADPSAPPAVQGDPAPPVGCAQSFSVRSEDRLERFREPGCTLQRLTDRQREQLDVWIDDAKDNQAQLAKNKAITNVAAQAVGAGAGAGLGSTAGGVGAVPGAAAGYAVGKGVGAVTDQVFDYTIADQKQIQNSLEAVKEGRAPRHPRVQECFCAQAVAPGDFRTVVQPAPPRPRGVRTVTPAITPKAAAALRDLLTSEARAVALLDALAVSMARAAQADEAGDGAAADRQRAAARVYADALARNLSERPALRRRALALLGRTGNGLLTPVQAGRLRAQIRARGFSPAARARLAKLGIRGARQSALRAQIAAASPAALAAATGLRAILNDPSALRTDKQLAAFARTLATTL